MTISITGQRNEKTGDLVGTVAFFDKSEKFILGSPQTSIVLIAKNKKKVIVSDENGDYVPTLTAGKYCIYSVQDEFGKRLKLWRRQHQCFNIREGKTTRFDISLLE